ncbi:hypothetical protein [Streptomyces auratus]|uniref:Uncharacterized protein n=1 Tax=Streptomyces auratus AGR0001 TaxID=1160718 RepID=A0A8B1NQ30_9ACTN|nr:hypothetical protein [Streptomyces auratus]QTZ92840.1 hypothetical protein SU9_016270 [Streptomyces auratus AGR0001]
MYVVVRRCLSALSLSKTSGQPNYEATDYSYVVAARRACAKKLQSALAGNSRPALLYQPSASSIHAPSEVRVLPRIALFAMAAVQPLHGCRARQEGTIIVMDAGLAAVLGAAVATVGTAATGWASRSLTKI